METVLKNLVNRLNRQWTKLGKYWISPNISSITVARQKLECQVMSRLFDSIVRPNRKSKKKGATKIQVRVIEYTIQTDREAKTYRLITSLIDLTRFPALLLAHQYHQRWEARKYH